MDPAESAELVAGRGIAGNTDQGGHRQVTIMDGRVWAELMRRFGSELSPAVRRANLLVDGINLEETAGRIIRIGSCRIKIHGETKPCERLNEALPGLKEAMRENWYGGAFGEVLDDGRISIGDEVKWER